MNKIIKSIFKLTLRRRLLLVLLLLGGCLSIPGSAAAATLDNACALLFEKLYANIAARGEIVALLPEKNEVVIEFADDLVPAYGAELLVFGQSSPVTDATESESNSDSEPQTPASAVSQSLIFRGSVTVSETAGHLNLAYVNSGAEKFFIGDLVFLPAPVQLYITPVRDLTPYQIFAPQATTAIGRMLGTFPGVEFLNLPASNQTTVDFLKNKCRTGGRYGLIVQPYILMQGTNCKIQLRLVSLFSGQSLGVLAEKFIPAVVQSQVPRYNQYQPNLPPRR